MINYYRSLLRTCRPFIIFFTLFLLTEIKMLHAQGLPIRPARTISFKTTEGSYMNVDVSPDGKTLVFDLLGDLYTVPASGGKANQLTRGMALNLRPVWSPNGKKIAYVSDRSGQPVLNIMDIQQKTNTVLSRYSRPSHESVYQRLADSDAVWSPDGRYIAYGERVYSLYGKELPAPYWIPHPLRFSPDGLTAYGLGSGKLYKYDLKTKVASFLDSGKIYKISFNSPYPKFLTGMISPDGRWWCYVTAVGKDQSDSRRQLIAMDLQHKTSRTLISSMIVIDPRYNEDIAQPVQHFSFSPDSKSIYIGHAGKIHQIRLADGKDKIIPFEAHVHVDMGAYNYHRQLVNLHPFDVKYTRSASKSPDGKHLIFTALGKIYTIDLPNGKPHELVSQPFGQFQPSWSPDGKWIAYTSWCDTVGGFLWRVSAAGGKPEQLTYAPAQYQNPVWLPDGQSIAVIRGPLSLNLRDEGLLNGQIQIVPLDGSSVRVIADTVPLSNNIPTFSPDGQTIFFTPKYHTFFSAQHQNIFEQLVAKNITTGQKRTLTVGQELTYQVKKMLSPDGRYLVYSADEDLYLVPMCAFTDSLIMSSYQGNYVAGVRFSNGVDPHWENGGKVLAWTYANHYYRIDPDKIMAKAEKATQTFSQISLQPNEPVRIRVKPDEAISLHVKTPAGYARGIIALRNARIITMQGNKVIEHGTILIKNGRIAAIGSVPAIQIPKSAKVLDLEGKTIMPGLIDVHLHMYYISPSIFSQQNWQLLTSLAYGVTTARDPSVSFDSFGYAELLQAGQMIGPRFYTVGRAVRFNDGVLHVDSYEDADNVIRQRVALGGSEIKQYALPTRLQREWLLLACRKYGVNMTNEGSYDPRLDIGMMKDGTTGIEHNPVWGDAYHDIITLTAKSRSYVTATLQVCYGEEEAAGYFDYTYWRHPDAKWIRFVYNSDPPTKRGIRVDPEMVFHTPPTDTLHPGFLTPAAIDARINNHGGRILLGSHGNNQGIGPHSELWALQMGGLSNFQALREATYMGAQALGIQKDLGSLEAGKIADLLILNSNPLDNIHNSKDIKYVMQGGILYDANTLDELWPVKRKCPEWKLKPVKTANSVNGQVKQQPAITGDNNN